MIEVRLEPLGDVYEEAVTGEGETLVEAVTAALEQVERRIAQEKAVLQALNEVGQRLARHAQELS